MPTHQLPIEELGNCSPGAGRQAGGCGDVNRELDFAKRPQYSPSRYTCFVASNVSDESTGLDWVASLALLTSRLAPCLSISRQPSARRPSAGRCGMDHRSSSVVLAAAAASGNVPKEVAIEPGAFEHVPAARRSRRRGLAAALERREHAASSRQCTPCKLLLEHDHGLRDVN